jgi:hypothetical protein
MIEFGTLEVLLDEDQLGEVIDTHFAEPGDVLQRIERQPVYNVPSQVADAQAWERDPRAVDTAGLRSWARVVRDDQRRGLRRERIRVFGAELTSDEAMTLDVAWPILAPYQEQRVLRRGEHPVPDVAAGDYFLIRRHTGLTVAIVMHYDETGAFQGAQIVSGRYGREPLLRDWELSWAIAEPFAEYEAGHPELHRRAVA